MTILDDMFGTAGTMDFLKDNFFEVINISNQHVHGGHLLWKCNISGLATNLMSILSEFGGAPLLESHGFTTMTK